MYKLTVKISNFQISYGIKSKHQRFDGLSRDKRAVKELCRLCNELELAECHFEDIIEDFLYDAEQAKKPVLK